jgi:hypothetical protein
MKKIWIAAVAGLLALGGIAIAQTISVPQVQIINPNDLFQDVVGGSPVVGNKYATAAQITSQSGYVKLIPLTGFISTFTNSESNLQLSPAGTLAWGYIYLAPAPSDGAVECIFTTQILTGATIYANTGQTINGAVTSFSANARACYLYSLSNLTWDRMD